jgi:hypothetical protein
VVYHSLDTIAVASGRNIVTVAVGPRGDLFVLSLAGTPDYRFEQDGSMASFPKKRADGPNQFRIHWQVDNEPYSLDLQETDENFHLVQPLGLDQWLLVRSRADDSTDRNAHVFSGTGEPIRSFHVGDGIEDVQTADDGQIWISFFDEGVFGDHSIGCSGLVCFDEEGHLNFTFSEVVARHPVSSIADCYAMNVASNEDVWLYYYTDFPLVRLRHYQFDRQWLNMPVRGSQAFAVMEDRVLFAGGYSNKGRLFLVSLKNMVMEEILPVGNRGETVKFVAAYGRGSRLYLDTDEAIYQLELRELR